MRLAKKLIPLLPHRPLPTVQPLIGNETFDVHLSLARKDIHISRPHDRRPLPELVEDIHNNHDGRGEIRLEEIDNQRLGRVGLPAYGTESRPELGDEHKYVEDEADPRSNDADRRAEGKFVQRVALEGPSFAETNVRKADAAPSEDGAEAREGEHPVEGVLLAV